MSIDLIISRVQDDLALMIKGNLLSSSLPRPSDSSLYQGNDDVYYMRSGAICTAGRVFSTGSSRLKSLSTL